MFLLNAVMLSVVAPLQVPFSNAEKDLCYQFFHNFYGRSKKIVFSDQKRIFFKAILNLLDESWQDDDDIIVYC
jgi:hypothetical protein